MNPPPSNASTSIIPNPVPQAAASLLSSSLQSSGPPSSLIIPISRTDIFPLPSPRTNTVTHNKAGDGSDCAATDDDLVAKQLELVSFPLLPGEGMVDSCGLLDGGRLILTNYRLYIQLGEGEEYHVPLGLVESVEVKELFYLGIGCKDARSYRCTFENNEQCLQWFGILLKASESPRQLHELFAFSYYAWSKENTIDDFTVRLVDSRSPVYDDAAFMKEVQRLQFGSVWRISSANEEYKMCSSYPPKLLVPSNIQDDKLEAVAKFRSSRRIPAVVWRHIGNGSVIARCSQPEVGWLGWRSSDDEDLVKEILHACAMDAMPATALDTYSHSPALSSDEDGGPFGYNGGVSAVIVENGGIAIKDAVGLEKDDERKDRSSDDVGKLQQNGVGARSNGELKVNTEKKVLIMDARSYTTAVANRARGGGCECPEYYPTCEIQFMNLANIHSIRKSFHALRQLCTSAADQPNWFSLLEGTRWLLHQSGLMRAAVTLVTAIERDARPVLVHCSDGWDRTPQIVALAQLLLDPYYRTTDGFRILIEREWLAFGHKFADRCGHTTGSEDQNERCPIFLQWLDCVHQLLEQFPCSFEFSDTYLVKLVQHTYSNLFGTFLCNTKKDRDKELFSTFPVWTFLDSSQFRNYLYKPSPPGVQVLWPQCNVRDLKLWSAVYLGSLETNKNDNTVQQQLTDVANLNNTNLITPYIMPDTNTTSSNSNKISSSNNNNNKRSTSAVPIAMSTPPANIKSSNAADAAAAAVSRKNQTPLQNNVMTKTRSYGDLMQMVPASPSMTCSKQCLNSANNGLQARVGVGGGGGVGGRRVVREDAAAAGRDMNMRRLSDPSSVDIKILNLAMVDHSSDLPNQIQCNVATFPTAHTYTNQQLPHINNVQQATAQLNTSSITQNDSSIETKPSNSTQRKPLITAAPNRTSDGIDIINSTVHKPEQLADECDINHNDSCEDLTMQCDFVVRKPGGVPSLKDSCERLLLNGHNIDTSTETLVAENGTIRASPFNTNQPPTPTNNHRDETDSKNTISIAYNCQNQNGSAINSQQYNPATTNSKLTCSVCAQNKRFVTETPFNQYPQKILHPPNKFNEPTIIQSSNSSRTIATGQQIPSANQSNGHCCVDGYYGSGSSNVTSGGNTPTSLMTDDSVTAALTGLNMMDSPGILRGMTTSNYWGATSVKMMPNIAASLGDDGLVPLRSEMQERVATLIEENLREVGRLKHELQKYRYALLQQLCHRCQHNDDDTYDDAPVNLNAHNASSSSFPTASCHCPITTNNPNHANGTVNGQCPTTSGGYFDGHNMSGSSYAVHESVTVVSSLRSDHSWDNVDDMLALEQQPTLWMPDHAVSRCADCRCEFWIGRRRHHCRKCGQIFCAECSENYAPIPTEHLYKPVRVCRGCFTTLKQSNTGLCDEVAGDQEIDEDNINSSEFNNEMEGVMTAPPPTTLPPNNYTPRNATDSMHIAPHKPPSSYRQPIQCCHHQHQQQQTTTSASVGGGCVVLAASGGSGNASSQITASSN